jgi:hypothetical protein
MITTIRPHQLGDPVTILYPDGEVLGTVRLIRVCDGRQTALCFDLPDELTLVKAPKTKPVPSTSAIRHTSTDQRP